MEPATDIVETAKGQKKEMIDIDTKGQGQDLGWKQSKLDLSCASGIESPLSLLTRCQQFSPAIYQSSATLLSSLMFPPYEFVHCDLDNDPDDCQITGEYQQSDELSSSSDENVQNDLE